MICCGSSGLLYMLLWPYLCFLSKDTKWILPLVMSRTLLASAWSYYKWRKIIYKHYQKYLLILKFLFNQTDCLRFLGPPPFLKICLPYNIKIIYSLSFQFFLENCISTATHYNKYLWTSIYTPNSGTSTLHKPVEAFTSKSLGFMYALSLRNYVLCLKK